MWFFNTRMTNVCHSVVHKFRSKLWVFSVPLNKFILGNYISYDTTVNTASSCNLIAEHYFLIKKSLELYRKSCTASPTEAPADLKKAITFTDKRHINAFEIHSFNLSPDIQPIFCIEKKYKTLQKNSQKQLNYKEHL